MDPSRDTGIFFFAILTQMGHGGKQASRQASKQAGKQASKQATKAPGEDSKKKTFCPTKVFSRCYPHLAAHSWETPHPASQAVSQPAGRQASKPRLQGQPRVRIAKTKKPLRPQRSFFVCYPHPQLPGGLKAESGSAVAPGMGKPGCRANHG